MAQQVLDCYKWEVLISKTMMDLVINKMFQCFHIRVKFYNFSLNIFPLLHEKISWRKKKFKENRSFTF